MDINYAPYSSCEVYKNSDKNHPFYDSIILNKLRFYDIQWKNLEYSENYRFGPNVCDLTLQDSSNSFPIIRKTEYFDNSVDNDISSFEVVIGNETDSTLKKIPLKMYLDNISLFTDAKVKGALYSEKSSKIITSTQACVMFNSNSNMEFNVKLFNCQSVINPAVLIIISSSQGTSSYFVLDLDNSLDFNKNGFKDKFVAKHFEEYTNESRKNALVIFQIPLKYVNPSFNISGLENSYEASIQSDLISNLPFEKRYERFLKERDSPSVHNGFSNIIIKHDDELFKKSFIPRLIYSIKEDNYYTFNKDPAATDYSKNSYTSLNVYNTDDLSHPSLSNFTIRRDESKPIHCIIQYYYLIDPNKINNYNIIKTIHDDLVCFNPNL